MGSAPYGSWETQAGPSVFAPFAADTEYFAADHQWMLNLRVDDLDGLCATLRAAGIEVGVVGGPPLGAPPGATLLVAGSPEEVQPAREAGMAVAAALWTGRWGGEPGADRAFERPADLTRAFAAWC